MGAMTLDQARDRLRRLADDCEERARRSQSGDARSLYWGAARIARQAIHGDLHGTLSAMVAQAELARWYDGEGSFDHENSLFVSQSLDGDCHYKRKSGKFQAKPADKLSVQAIASVPLTAMNARQLATRYNMPERSARRAIERGVQRRWAGFYRDGRHWYAEPEAFDRARRGKG